jgi:hypothetical protein
VTGLELVLACAAFVFLVWGLLESQKNRMRELVGLGERVCNRN